MQGSTHLALTLSGTCAAAEHAPTVPSSVHHGCNVLVTGLNSLAHACCGTEQHPQVPRKHAQQRTCFCCCRSAPLPIKVDGFSMGAVMGYSEQHTLLLMTSDEEVETFLNVGQSPAQQQCDSLLREYQ